MKKILLKNGISFSENKSKYIREYYCLFFYLFSLKKKEKKNDKLKRFVNM